MVGLARLDGTATQTADVIAALERDGGVIIEDFLSGDTLAGLRGDLLPQLDGQSAGRDSFSGHRTRRLSRLFARTAHMAEIALHPLYLPVAEHFVARPRDIWVGDTRHAVSADIRIGVTQAIQIAPGETAQPLHRDDAVFLWRHPTGGREGRVQIICAISDFTADNGGTRVIPGSHLWDDERQPHVAEAVATEMKSGSALIFLGSTYHGGGANVTGCDYRTAVGMALDAANVRQEENQYLSLTRDEVARFPEQIQRLLGWSAGRNHMGWVEIDGQMTDPIRLLRPQDGAEVVGVGAH